MEDFGNTLYLYALATPAYAYFFFPPIDTWGGLVEGAGGRVLATEMGISVRDIYNDITSGGGASPPPRFSMLDFGVCNLGSVVRVRVECLKCGLRVYIAVLFVYANP